MKMVLVKRLLDIPKPSYEHFFEVIVNVNDLCIFVSMHNLVSDRLNVRSYSPHYNVP